MVRFIMTIMKIITRMMEVIRGIRRLGNMSLMRTAISITQLLSMVRLIMNIMKIITMMMEVMILMRTAISITQLLSPA